MDLVVFSEAEVIPVLRALRAVALANEAFTEAEAQLVRGVGCLHGVAVDPRALDPISPAEVAAAVVDPHKRKRVVQLALVMALVEGAPDARAEQAVRELGAALDVPEPGIRVLHDVASDHALIARFDMMRRLRPFVTRRLGLPGIFQILLPALGIGRDAALEARFEALGALPAGTLGRGLFDQYKAHGFHFPGSPEGLPERFVFHDIGHVLSGYDVDPQGEIQQAAFQAGFVRNDGFAFLLFGILQFHVGIKITPIADAEKGYFDVRKVLRAAARGAACKVDLSDDFDFWPHAGEQLSVLRERWGIAPL